MKKTCDTSLREFGVSDFVTYETPLRELRYYWVWHALGMGRKAGLGKDQIGLQVPLPDLRTPLVSEKTQLQAGSLAEARAPSGKVPSVFLEELELPEPYRRAQVRCWVPVPVPEAQLRARLDLGQFLDPVPLPQMWKQELGPQASPLPGAQGDRPAAGSRRPRRTDAD